MGSVFTTTDKFKIPGSFGKERPVPFYLQFVPGYVVEAVVNQSDTAFMLK